MRWINPGRAARDETAFRHGLKTAHRLRAAGQRMTDAAIIDAYERAYNIAQREGADGRAAEIPPMRDRQTMARRVRGYVTQGKTDSYATPTAKYATTSQRKALAIMGHKGGKKAAQRWETDPEGECAQGRRATLQKTHRKKKAQGVSNRQRVGLFITVFWVEMDRLPTWSEIQAETGLSRATVARHVSALKESGDLPT